MQHLKMKLFACVLFVAACQPTIMENKVPSTQSTLPPVKVVHTSELKIVSHPKIASFTIPTQNDQNRLQIFVTPSCNFCERIFLKVLDAKKNGNPNFSNTTISFSLIPRKDLDVQIISGFMCIPANRRHNAVIDYYSGMMRVNGGEVIENSAAIAMYEQIMTKYGISDDRRRVCELDDQAHSLIAAVYLVADNYRTQDRVPVVVYNGKYINALNYKDLERKVR